MSGIIGGAGSKSGVIGTTELENEFGTWTPNQNGYVVVGAFTSYGYYVKLNNWVWVYYWVKGATSIAVTGTPSLTDLPFPIPLDLPAIPYTWAHGGITAGVGFAWSTRTYASTSSHTSASSSVLNVQLNYRVD
jgi:hypothetical protein